MTKSFDEIIAEKLKAHLHETYVVDGLLPMGWGRLGACFKAGAKAAVEALGVVGEEQKKEIESFIHTVSRHAANPIFRSMYSRSRTEVYEEFKSALKWGVDKGLAIVRAESHSRISTLEAQNAELKEKLDEAVEIIERYCCTGPNHESNEKEFREFLSRIGGGEQR